MAFAGGAGAKGDQYRAAGEAALNRSPGIFAFLSGSSNQKYEEAAEAFTKAGNQYKLANDVQKAGDAFLQAAEAYKLEGSSETDYCNAIVEAGNSFKKGKLVAEAIQTYEKAVEIYGTNGRFGMAARLYKDMAEMFEADNNLDGALQCYEQCAEFFLNDNKPSNATQIKVKIATLCSTHSGDLIRAAQLFQEIAEDSLNSRLGAYSAKGYAFQCIACQLAAGDSLAADRSWNSFANKDHTFATSREGGFLKKLLEATEAMDGEAFATACADYDNITPLDPWKTSMLLKAKKHIAGSEEAADLDLS